ncbi:MAG: hypothetical protein ACR2PC_03610 [Tsuneonella suprasediminis]|uniref:Uncharacterized protein n=1 Tax=Tsuneonella suprasediminis TaxID=2306996 RepID=A0A419R5P4_9SPHN|nr:hypothetical protein [Tsuneonella suprasediminis]RJX70899.1 hypothetical protein D6858_01865 [Tsuneonella suprasediminis]UBS31565.1 hypothetical protein LBX01_08545 [Altererythrobacter sp. N1]
MKKDRVLRGDGISFPPENDAGHWDGTSDREIMAQAEALKSALPDEQARDAVAPVTLPSSFSERASKYWDDNRWWLGLLGLGLGALSLVAGFIA